jgi:hypothetical protein
VVGLDVVAVPDLTRFIKIHRTLRVSPAMAAGVTDRLWVVILRALAYSFWPEGEDSQDSK